MEVWTAIRSEISKFKSQIWVLIALRHHVEMFRNQAQGLVHHSSLAHETFLHSCGRIRVQAFYQWFRSDPIHEDSHFLQVEETEFKLGAIMCSDINFLFAWPPRHRVTTTIEELCIDRMSQIGKSQKSATGLSQFEHL